MYTLDADHVICSELVKKSKHINVPLYEFMLTSVQVFTLTQAFLSV